MSNSVVAPEISTAALLTAISTFPYLSTATLNNASTSSSEVTSTFTATASVSFFATSIAPSILISPITTLQPSLSSLCARASPNPWAAPVITATFPSSLLISMIPPISEPHCVFHIRSQSFHQALHRKPRNLSHQVRQM